MASNVTENIDGYEFSDNQKKLWNVGKDQLDAFYNQLVVSVTANKTLSEVVKSIQTIIGTHEIFTFRSHNNYQYYYPVQYQYDATFLDYIEVDGNAQDAQKTVDAYLSRPFDPSENAAIRFCFTVQGGFVQKAHIRLYSLWGDTYTLLFLAKRMNALLEATPNTTDESDIIPYINYAAWQNDLIKNPEDDAKAFWKTYTDEKSKTVIPFQKATLSSFAPKRKQITVLNAEAKKKIEANCNAKNSTLSSGLLYQYLAFLSTFTNEKLTIGYVQNGRIYDELQGTLGLVNKTLPVVLDTASIITNKDIEAVNREVTQVNNWSDYYTIKKDDAQQCFNYSFECISAEDLNSATADVYSVQNTFRVKLSCIVYANSIAINLYYDAGYYGEADINVIEAQLKKQFSTITEGFETTRELSAIEQTIIDTANATSNTFETYQAITELIDIQTSKNPEATAIVYDGKQLTYKQLQEKVNKLANCIVNEYKINKGDAVCILLERSESFIISILSVLKAGAYYVPISKEYPQERIQFIIEDTACKLLLTDEEIEATAQIQVLNPSKEENFAAQSSTFETVAQNSDVAYCIYTSGSTGNPKGCLITHENLLNYVLWANQYYFTDESLGNWGFLTAVSFDLSVTAIFTSLTRGKMLTIEKEEGHVIELLKKSFENPAIDTLKLTPAHLSLLAELDIETTAVKIIICGGEQLTSHQVQTVKSISENITLFNEYGPTEGTVGCITKIAKVDEKIYIGKPIANMSVAIVNSDNKACEIGATGEIIISGKGISKGYLNREDLTAEKFVVELAGKKGNYYKTGDLGRWTATGEIEFLGRKDDQVKIRGYRIELGEIEKYLATHPAIEEAVVVVRENEEATEKELVAYVRSKETLNAGMIQEFLSTKVPEYMLPEHYVQLVTFPLTVNGKVDRKALPEPYGMSLSSGVEYKAPSTETEHKLANLWEETLKRERIGVNDNFFFIGGNSLKAMNVINHIHQQFEVKLQLKDFFESATISDIAKQIDASIMLRNIKEEMNSDKEFESEITL